MALEKKKLEPIKHEKARLATFKKRKGSLLKKAWEFKTLCDVDVCMIIYGPKHGDQPVKSETWASEEGKVTSIINKYIKSTQKDDHRQTTSSSPKFYENKKRKVDDKAVRVRKNNPRLDCGTWDQRFDSFSEDQLKKILSRLDAKIEVAGKKLDMMKGDLNVIRKATSETSEDSQVSLNLPYQNIDSHRKGQSIDIQQPTKLQPDNEAHQMSSSLMETPVWMWHNVNNPYQSSGASSSTIPYIQLQGPVHWNLTPSRYVPTIQPSSLSKQFPGMASDYSNENAVQVNESSDILKTSTSRKQG